MVRPMKIWRTILHAMPVNWGCYNPRTYAPSASGDFARMLRLRTITLDGRELETVLTPTEGRALMRRLGQQLDAIDRMNRVQGNGYAPDVPF